MRFNAYEIEVLLDRTFFGFPALARVERVVSKYSEIWKMGPFHVPFQQSSSRIKEWRIDFGRKVENRSLADKALI